MFIIIFFSCWVKPIQYAHRTITTKDRLRKIKSPIRSFEIIIEQKKSIQKLTTPTIAQGTIVFKSISLALKTLPWAAIYNRIPYII